MGVAGAFVAYCFHMVPFLRPRLAIKDFVMCRVCCFFPADFYFIVSRGRNLSQTDSAGHFGSCEGVAG
ncbi:hypothetical protein EVA_08548 [gut metagenome]|uniref:Uncharacterized protein n=1 Tax=gut metagenome TaxID=749906 RepID=J9GM76_9ZZZZ